MGIRKAIQRLFVRNMAMSDFWEVKLGQPKWNTWSIENAVSDGYKVNPAVYRSVFLITKAVTGVPFIVQASDGEEIIDHSIAKLLQKPCPAMSRKSVMELIVSWLELAGNGYLKKVQAGGSTQELWPVSPDRLAPIPSSRLDEMIKGYAKDGKPQIAYKPEEIVHLKLFNPADPLVGISPLQAAAKTVDVDVAQQSFQKAAMDNDGVIGGVFSFDRQFNSQEETDAVANKLNERYAGPKNAKRIGVVGSKAKYYRTALTPEEMDFIESRKSNATEIYQTFGVPPVYAGIQEVSTYNNYMISELIFWVSTVIPLLDDICDDLTFALQDELGDLQVTIQPAKIPALRNAFKDSATAALALFKMGVPFSEINRVFGFGINEYDGWDISFISGGSMTDEQGGNRSQNREAPSIYIPEAIEFERRDFQSELEEKENFAKDYISPTIQDLLDKQREAVFQELTEGSNDIAKAVKSLDAEWEEVLTSTYTDVGLEFAKKVKVKSERQLDPEIEQAIQEEMDVLKEKTEIQQSTIDQIEKQVTQGISEGWAINDIQQAIIDAGVFDANRALRIARTVTGSAASVGQYVSGKQSGATHKRWITAGFETRDWHVARSGETVPIDGRFSAQVSSTGPRYPCDPYLAPEDRINCRCSMDFIKKEPEEE